MLNSSFLKSSLKKPRTKKFKRIKTLFSIFFIVLALLSFSGCGAVQSLITSIPLFEEADLSSLTEKAEKAWDEVGKDALKDATDDAKNTLMGKNEDLKWPVNESTEKIPPVNSGSISKINAKNTLTEITVKEISKSGYEEYISSLEKSIGSPVSKGIYRCDNRLISAIYDDETSTLTITISTIRQSIESSEESSDESSLSADISEPSK